MRRANASRRSARRILRINASLDVATVLQEAVDSARALTAARCGIITTIDETGEVRDFVSSGSADYIVKPFSPAELTARVGAALRRVARAEPFVLEGLAIHCEARRVTAGGREAALTATEYDILRMLSVAAGGWSPTTRCYARSGTGGRRPTSIWCATS